MCTEIHESFHFGLKASNLVELKIRALQSILDMEPPLKMFGSVFMHLLKEVLLSRNARKFNFSRLICFPCAKLKTRNFSYY